MVSQESGYQCLGGEPGFMMSRDAEADDMNWQTNTWMKAAYLGWQCNMNETNGYNYKFWQIYYQWILNANKILAEMKATQIHMQDLSADRNIMIRIGCISPVLWDLLPRVVRSFLMEPENKHMKLDFQTDTTTSLINMLRDGNCDFLICSAYKDEGIQQTELLSEPFVLLCPPQAEIPASWDELFAKGVIGFKEQTMAFYEFIIC